MKLLQRIKNLFLSDDKISDGYHTFDQDRIVVIHTLKGENTEVNGYFIQKDLDDQNFYLTDLNVIPES